MITNYEGIEISDKQVRAFRRVLKLNWEETLARGVRGKGPKWSKALLDVTEGRRSLYKNGKRTHFHSWCGDWTSYNLERAGCLHKCLNRESINGKWISQHNLTIPMAWSGYNGWLPKKIKRMFANDPSAGDSWHWWDNKKDQCKDGYVPQLGDLVLCPRKNGDHIEFFISLKDKILTVSAGAQIGGTALIRDRDLDIEELRGIINVAKLAPSSPY